MARFDEYFTSLRGKRIAVLGLGVSNRPLVRLLLEFGCTVTGCDRTPREQLDAEVLELEQLGLKAGLLLALIFPVCMFIALLALKRQSGRE